MAVVVKFDFYHRRGNNPPGSILHHLIGNWNQADISRLATVKRDKLSFDHTFFPASTTIIYDTIFFFDYLGNWFFFVYKLFVKFVHKNVTYKITASNWRLKALFYKITWPWYCAKRTHLEVEEIMEACQAIVAIQNSKHVDADGWFSISLHAGEFRSRLTGIWRVPNAYLAFNACL